MTGALSFCSEEACGSVGSSPKKCLGCASTHKEPGCEESNNFTGEYVASEIHKGKGSETECSALHLPISGYAEETRKDKIVPLEGKPYFTAVMGENSVCRKFLVRIPKNFSQFLPPSSASIVLCCREKEWAVKYRVSQTIKVIREGWKQFVMDNSLKIGDGCVFELMSNRELKFRVQILSGELPAIPRASFAAGNNIDTPILID